MMALAILPRFCRVLWPASPAALCLCILILLVSPSADVSSGDPGTHSLQPLLELAAGRLGGRPGKKRAMLPDSPLSKVEKGSAGPERPPTNQPAGGILLGGKPALECLSAPGLM